VVRGLAVLALVHLALFTASVLVSVGKGKIRVADFAAFYTASHVLATEGPAAAYVPEVMIQGEKTWIWSEFPFPIYWNYPPVFYFWVKPLAWLSYHPALELWFLAQYVVYLAVFAASARSRLGALLLVAFPAVALNLSYGQNGLLLACLLGGGLRLLDERPVAAGVLLGSLVFKPHLLVLVIPAALAAGRRWRALAATLGTAGVWCLASLAIHGWPAWQGFLGNVPRVGELLRIGRLPLKMMPSAYAGLMLPTGSFALASRVQTLVTLTTMGCLVSLWWRDAPRPERSSAVALATLLSTPWSVLYDMAIMAIPLTWLALDPERTGGGRLEALLAMGVWVAPVLHSPLAQSTGFAVSPILMLGWMLVLTVRGLRTPSQG
jgi:hypothetical protein